MPHMYHVGRTTADPDRLVPIGYWMHRGGVPFVSPEVFQNIYWATVKPIVEELWKDGLQTMFYAEGKWDRHLEAFAELPEKSIVYHVDQGDIFLTHRVLGEKFCISGGIPNYLLGIGSPQQVREYCKKVIDGVARDGGYIMDAGAIIQNDARVENIRAMTDFTREYGVYPEGHSRVATPPPQALVPRGAGQAPAFLQGRGALGRGVCVPWEQKRKDIAAIPGDEALVQRIWEEIEGLANMFIWQILVSF